MKPIFQFVIMLLSLPFVIAFLFGFDYMLLLAHWASMGWWPLLMLTISVAYAIGFFGASLIGATIARIEINWMHTITKWLTIVGCIGMCLLYLYSVWVDGDRNMDMFYTFAVFASLGYLFICGYLMKLATIEE